MPESEDQIGPTFAISIVDVCNNSLDEIGQNPIQSLDEDNPRSQACRSFFPSILRAMIRDHYWKFSKRRVYLPLMAQEKVLQILAGYGSGGFGGGGFGGGLTEVTVTAIPGPRIYWYGMPNNCVRARRINGDDCYTFEVQGRILMTDYTPVYLDYGAYIDDPNVWPGDFQIAYESLLSSRLAKRLLKDLKLAGTLYALYLQQKDEAKAVDSQEGTPEKLQSNHFIRIRE